MRGILLLVLLLGLPLSVGGMRCAEAATDSAGVREKISEKVSLMLSERHPDDRAERWTSLGEQAPFVIIQMAEETQSPPHHVRLIGALRFFPESSEAVQYLKQQVENSSSSLIKRSAVRSIALSQGAKELGYVSGFLDDPDPNMRAVAAESLQAMRDPRADVRLKSYLADEKVSWIVAKVADDARLGPVPLPSERAVSQKAVPVPAGKPLDPLWKGTWKGTVIRPDKAPGSLRSEKARFEVDPLNRSATLWVGGQAAKWIDPLFDGRRVRAKLKVPGGSALEGAEGELVERSGVWLLRIQTMKSGLFVVLRKEGR